MQIKIVKNRIQLQVTHTGDSCLSVGDMAPVPLPLETDGRRCGGSVFRTTAVEGLGSRASMKEELSYTSGIGASTRTFTVQHLLAQTVKLRHRLELKFEVSF
jgi:hypothetical protein